MPIEFTNREIPKVLFANCGHFDNARLIEDSVRLNYISAGQGKSNNPPAKPYYFSNQIRKLIIGDIIAVYRSKIGYVGIAKVISRPMPITKAILGGQKVVEGMFSKSSKMYNESDDEGFEECLVEVHWLTKVHLNNTQGSGNCFGGLTPRYTVGELQEERYKCLETSFKINFQELLNEPLMPNLGFEKIIIDEDEEVTFPEGKEKFALHRFKERNKKLIEKAKENYFKIDNKLKCQVCQFSFVESYGDLGIGFIEAHHLYPISELIIETETKIEDIAFLCSNCHRMVHRQRPWLNLEALTAIKI